MDSNFYVNSITGKKITSVDDSDRYRSFAVIFNENSKLALFIICIGIVMPPENFNIL
jgi:hypothetical protein